MVNRSIQVSPPLGQVSKTDVCVRITRLLLSYSLEDFSRFTNIIKGFNATTKIELSGDLKSFEPNVLLVLSQQFFTVLKRFIQHFFSVLMFVNFCEQNRIIV